MMKKLTHLQIYKTIYKRHLKWYKKYGLKEDKASRLANIFAVKNTNTAYVNQHDARFNGLTT